MFVGQGRTCIAIVVSLAALLVVPSGVSSTNTITTNHVGVGTVENHLGAAVPPSPTQGTCASGCGSTPKAAPVFRVVGSFPVGSSPWGVAYDPTNGYVYVTNSGSDNVSVVDPATGHQVASIGVGKTPYQIAYDSVNDYLYVANDESNTTSVIDGSTNSVIKTIPIGYLPYAVMVDPANGDIYVTDSGGPNVTMISGATDKTIGSIGVGANGANWPIGIALDTRDNWLYVADDNDPTYSYGVVDVYNLTSGTTVGFASIDVNPQEVAYDPQNGNVYVAAFGKWYVDVIRGGTTNWTGQISAGVGPLGMLYDPSNHYILNSDENANVVSVIDGSTGSMAQTINVGHWPRDMAYDSANGDVFVADGSSNNVSVLAQSPIFPLNLTETGLSPGTSWSVSLNGTSNSSTTATIGFRETNGTYSYSVATVPGYTASPSSGSITVSGSAVAQTITFTRSVNSIPVGSGPIGLAYDSANGYVYVANGGSNNISVLSGTKVIASVPAYNSPWGLAYDAADGYVYAANWGGGSGTWVVTVVNGTRDVANMTYSTGGTMAPMGVTYDSTNGTVWVANDAGNGFGVTVLKGLKIVWNITIPSASSGIAFDPSHNYVYTSDRSSTGTVDVMDASGTFDSFSVGGFAQAYWDTYDPYHHQVYVSEYGGNDLMVMNGTKVTGNVTAATSPMGVAVDPVSGLLFVTQYGQASVNVVNGTQSVGTIPVGTNPIDAVYDPANGFIYVANRGSNNVSIINTGGKASTTLSGVAVSPSSSTLSPNGTQLFTANPSCVGGPCAPNVTYSWSLTNGLGTLSSTSGNPVTFTAGTNGGNLSLFVNATLNGTTKRAGPIPIVITTSVPVLASVVVSPPSASIPTNTAQSFSATPSCSGGPCPSGTSYAWTLNNSLGSVNPTTGASTTFTAGPTAGSVSLTVTATLNGISKQAVAPVTITSTSALTSVTIAPSSPSVTVNGTQAFTATPACTSTCPGSVAYVWTVNNSLGSVNPATGSTTTFTAGPTSGVARVTVAASLSGVTKWANATITITPVVPVLSSVSISPTSITMGVGNSTSFTAHPNCTGGTCPSGATFAWSLNNTAMGAISPTTGPAETFTAGNTAGSVLLYATASLNGMQQTGLALINITKGTVPVVTGLTLTPSPTVTVQVGKTITFNTAATCNVSPCPLGIAYIWVLNNTLGNLSTTSGSSVVFRAGTSAGATSLAVTAQLNGGSKTATSDITITNSAVPVITGVTIAPSTATVQVNQGHGFTANATCSPGPCPSSTTYTWTLNNSLGSVNPWTGTSTQFMAGSSPGSVTLRVNATFNGKTVTSSVTISITQTTPVPENGTSPSTFLGLPGYEGYILLIVIAAVVAAAAVIALTLRKKPEAVPPPSTGYQGYSQYPEYSQPPPYPPGQ